MELLGSVTLSSPAASINFSGLTVGLDSELFIDVAGKADHTDDAYVTVSFNGEGTATNHWYQRVDGFGSSIVTNRYNNGLLGVLGGDSGVVFPAGLVEARIWVNDAGQVSWLGMGAWGDNVGTGQLMCVNFSGVYTQVVAGITSVTLGVTVGSGFSTGTSARLFKL